MDLLSTRDYNHWGRLPEKGTEMIEPILQGNSQKYLMIQDEVIISSRGIHRTDVIAR